MDPRKKKLEIFETMSIKKALFKLAWPSILMMLSLGLYTFCDSILAVRLAGRHYVSESATTFGGMFSGSDLVRLFMNAANPIVAFMMAISLLFGIGSSVRYSINLGAKKYDQAFMTIRSGFMSAFFISIILIPILYFSAKSWMEAMYEGAKGPQLKVIIDNGFQYIKVLIFVLPLTVFNQMISALFRTEGRVKLVSLLFVPSLLINLFLDWVFMGPADMGVVGGALATTIAYSALTIAYVIIILRTTNTHVKFHNLFGFTHINWIVIIAILAVGSAPFLRNLAQSVAGTFESRVIGDVSKHFGHGFIYGRNILSGVFPVFGLLFPMIFGFAQGAIPIASYNYGAGKIKRVKETILWCVVFATIFGIGIYALVATPHLLGVWLLKALNVQSQYIDESLTVVRIIMVGIPLFGAAIGAMALFSSTDRLVFSLISNSLRGFILFFPFVYFFKWTSYTCGSTMNSFWWFYPALVITTALVSIVMMWIVLRRLHNKTRTLDQRLDSLVAKFGKGKVKKPIKLSADWTKVQEWDKAIERKKLEAKSNLE